MTRSILFRLGELLVERFAPPPSSATLAAWRTSEQSPVIARTLLTFRQTPDGEGTITQELLACQPGVSDRSVDDYLANQYRQLADGMERRETWAVPLREALDEVG